MRTSAGSGYVRWTFVIIILLSLLEGCSQASSVSSRVGPLPDIGSFGTAVPKIPATLDTYAVKGGGYGRGIAAGADGALWVTFFYSGSLGQIYPPSSAHPSPTVRKFPIKGLVSTASLYAAPGGALWFSGQSDIGQYVGAMYLSATGNKPNYRLFSLPEGQDARGGITVGPLASAIWFGSVEGNAIIRMTIPDASSIPKFNIIPLPSPSSNPWAVALGHDHAVWFTECQAGKIGRVTSAGQLTEFALGAGSAPKGIAAGPDGAMWYSDDGLSSIGRIDRNGHVTSFRIPRGQYLSNPAWLTVGADSAIWFTAPSGKGAVGRLTSDGGLSKLTNGVQEAQGITTGPDGAMWIARHTPTTIVRILPSKLR